MCSFKDGITQKSLNIIMFLCVSVEEKGSRGKKERGEEAWKETKLIIKSVVNIFADSPFSSTSRPFRKQRSRWICNLIQFSRWFWSGVKLEWVSDWAIWDQTFEITRNRQKNRRRRVNFSLRSVSRSPLWKRAAHSFSLFPFSLPVSFVRVFKTIGRCFSLLWIICCFTKKWF